MDASDLLPNTRQLAFLLHIRDPTIAYLLAFLIGWNRCWALMALLFVGGVMNLLWVAAIALAVLAEKLVPRGHLIAKALSVALVLGGVLVIVAGLRYGPMVHG